VFVGGFIVGVVVTNEGIFGLVAGRGVAEDGSFGVGVGVSADGRVEEPVPWLVQVYQKRFIAFCMFNYFIHHHNPSLLFQSSPLFFSLLCGS
jgi:hypothetical protein